MRLNKSVAFVNGGAPFRQFVASWLLRSKSHTGHWLSFAEQRLPVGLLFSYLAALCMLATRAQLRYFA